MKIISFLCCYNDNEYLDQTISSFKDVPDKLFIIEGSWKSSQKYKQSLPRSNKETYDIINKYVDNKKVFLVQANEQRERNQRQLGLELAKKENADWCWMLDSDEVYLQSSCTLIKSILHRNINSNVLGYRLNSYNFINSFKKWYHGNYMRIYKVTPQAQFYMDNDVQWPDKQGVISQIFGFSFYHYNYVKQNSEQFYRKMFYQNEQDPTFNTRILPQYGFNESTKQYKIPDDCKIYNFIDKHPKIMQNHPYFVNDIFKDGKIEYC